jgi:iron complex transport system ATP-binding protein
MAKVPGAAAVKSRLHPALTAERATDLYRCFLLDRLDALAASHPELAVVQVGHRLEELAGSTTHALLLRRGAVVASGAAGEVLREEPLSRCFEAPVRLARVGGRVLAVIERGRP